MAQDRGLGKPGLVWSVQGGNGVQHCTTLNRKPQCLSQPSWLLEITSYYSFSFSIFAIVYASQMSCNGNFVHTTNFSFIGGRLEKGVPSH